ncbi:MAG: hypothetical protein JNM82_12385 [Rhodocyclaceae bacterium]|nr:hypothetical protein [Rhodocyclaceae bacterium]
MKQAKRRPARPRNPVAVAPIMKKGGAHQRRDKRLSRAAGKARWRREGGEA